MHVRARAARVLARICRGGGHGEGGSKSGPDGGGRASREHGLAGEAVGLTVRRCVNVRECMGARVGRRQSRRDSGRDRRRGRMGTWQYGCASVHACVTRGEVDKGMGGTVCVGVHTCACVHVCMGTVLPPRSITFSAAASLFSPTSPPTSSPSLRPSPPAPSSCPPPL